MNRRGFTLIELMIVTATIGILAAISVPVFKGHNAVKLKVGDCIAHGRNLESWEKKDFWRVEEKGQNAWRIVHHATNKEGKLEFGELWHWSLVPCE